MKRCLFTLPIFFHLLFLAGALEAQQSGVQVRIGGQELFETEPKNVVTATFEITNTSDEELEFVSQVKLPTGWKQIIPSLPFRLAPKATEIRLVSFYIPQTTLVGKYKIIYQLSSLKYPSISGLARLYVVVRSITNLQAEFLQAPESVIAGQPYEAIFSVINASNRENSVGIKVTSGQDLPVIVNPEQLKLAPGEANTVKVTVNTDEKIRNGFKHHLSLIIQSDEDEKIRDQARCTVDIIPKITGEVDRFHRIPAELTIIPTGQKSEQDMVGLQGELSGRGKLTEGGEDEIAFLFRGPDTIEDNSMFGQRDRVFVEYRNKAADVLLGDNYYALSHLTEQSVDGRGAGGGLVLGDFGLRGYHMATRWFASEERETALHFDYLFNDRYGIGLNLFKKQSDVEDAQIASLQAKLEPFKNTNIEFEAAYGKDDNAFWLDFYGSPALGGSYRFEYIYAQPDFPGYYQDSQYVSGNFFFPVTNSLTLSSSLRQEKGNLDLDSSTESATLSRYGQIGLNYRFEAGTTLSVESLLRTRKDRLPDPDFDNRELTYKIRLGHTFEMLFLNVSAEQGKVKDRLKDQTSDVGIYEGSCYFMLTHNQSYGAFVRYSDYSNSEDEDRNTINTGLTGTFKIGENASLNLSVDRCDSMGTDSGDRNNFDLALSYQFANKSRISAHGRHTLYGSNSEQEDETALIVLFRIPFGLPVGRKNSIGVLDGTIHDQETGQPIPNVVLHLNGATAVTDNDGEFTFPSLKPGNFRLNVDSASIGLDRIPAQKTSLEVDIEGGKEESIDIEITKSADFVGKIMIYEFAKEDGLQKGFSISKGGNKATETAGRDKIVETRSLPNALLELKSEQETWRVLADKKGRFRFDDVRPGDWILTIHADNIPQYHYLEKDNFEIELTPGERKEMLIRVLPKKRTIQIIEQGGTLIEEEEN